VSVGDRVGKFQNLCLRHTIHLNPKVFSNYADADIEREYFLNRGLGPGFLRCGFSIKLIYGEIVQRIWLNILAKFYIPFTAYLHRFPQRCAKFIQKLLLC
jgi:hypothetical protein